MTTLTRRQIYVLARAAAKGGDFKIEFHCRPMAIAFLCDVAGTQDAHYRDRWDLGDGYVATFGIGNLVVFRREEA